MADFERSRQRRSRSSDRGRRGRRSDNEFKGKRSFGRDNRRDNRSGRDEMTKVTCSECKEECEVPFKPTSTKPVYCSNCFEKHDPKNNNSSNNHSERDLDIINEKLNKIMKALKIE